MTRSGRSALVVALVLGASAVWFWMHAGSPEERQIRQRLDALAADMNAGSPEGIGALTRAARIGQFLTPDVVVELGKGTAPIHGRDTLVGMAARLQPRTAAFVVELNDVTVRALDSARADVTLTLMIRQRSADSGEETLDAREFSLDLRQEDGDWRIHRVLAIDTFR